MLKKNEIIDKARAWAQNVTSQDFAGRIASAYIRGYNSCQETIPSECIGFAEWILANGIIYTIYNDGMEYIKIGDGGHRDKVIAKTTSELYSIYLESLKQNK